MKSVLVTGATGFIGRNLVGHLLERGAGVTALVRDASRASNLLAAGARVVEGDITDPRAVLTAVDGASHAVHLAAMTSSAGTDYRAAARVNLVGTKNLVDACRAQDVARLIVVGTQSDNRGAYARSKREADDLVRRSDVPHVLINPSLVYGPGASGLFATIARVTRKLPVIPMIGSGSYPMRPIFIDDTCNAIIRALEVERPLEQYYISGPDEITFRDFLGSIAATQGRKKLTIRVPYVLVLTALVLAETLRVKLPVSSDTLKGLVHPRMYDSLAAARDLDFAPISWSEGLRRSFV